MVGLEQLTLSGNHFEIRRKTMKKKTISIIFASLLLILGTSYSFAQNAPQWKVGDKVEVKNMSGEWVPASIIEVVDWRQYGKGFAYRIVTDDKNAANNLWNAPADTVRARGGGQDPNQQANNQTDDAAQNPNQGGALEVGSSVDVYWNQKQGKNHATILKVLGNGKYKVHYAGCGAYWDEEVDSSLIRSFSTVSKDAPEIKFLFGKWSMTTVGISDWAIAWGKSPGIQINGDGSYIWYQDGGKPPVRGKWTTDAKLPGADLSPQKNHGILIKDADGVEWKVYRWITQNDDGNHIEVQRMCSAESSVGKRVQ
jgi:hypothetical protein